MSRSSVIIFEINTYKNRCRKSKNNETRPRLPGIDIIFEHNIFSASPIRNSVFLASKASEKMPVFNYYLLIIRFQL